MKITETTRNRVDFELGDAAKHDEGFIKEAHCWGISKRARLVENHIFPQKLDIRVKWLSGMKKRNGTLVPA
jgi:hypothetical protein